MHTILYIFFIIGYSLLGLIVVLVLLSAFRRVKERKYSLDDNYRPTASLVVPAHNEAEVIERTIIAFLNTSYPEELKEMIVVNDGSTDKTREVAGKYAYRIIEDGIERINESGRRNVTLVNRGVGGNGKARASNEGAKYAKGEIFFFIDADVKVSPNIFERAVRHFGDSKVGAIAGYIEVASNKSVLNDFISFESILAQKVVRAGFNVLGIQYVIPGGCAVFRQDIWKRVWGYATDSLAEDTDLTWKVLMETRKEIRFDDTVMVRADEPQTLMSLWNQRVRWGRGNLEVTRNHWYKVGKSNYGSGATHLFPFWLASTLTPIIFILNAIGVLLAVFYKMDVSVILLLHVLLSSSFLISFVAGWIAGKGKSLLGGLFSPGLPMLCLLLSNIFYREGIYGLFHDLGINADPRMISLALALWTLASIPLTYLMVSISKKHEALAQAIQLSVLGYWSLIVASSLHGYALEARGRERRWIRTVR